MFKNTFIIILGLLLLFSCSSTQQNVTAKGEILESIDIQNKNLEYILDIIRSRYGYDLDVNVEDLHSKKWSLKSTNCNINDLLKKISQVSGLYLKVKGNDIVVQKWPFYEDLKEITLNLNGNAWKDIRSASKEEIDTVSIKNYFGPLLKSCRVYDIDNIAKTVTLGVLKENEKFIIESLTILNYLKQKRNLVITVMLLETKDLQQLKKGSIPKEKVKFSWNLNAGDNIGYNLNGKLIKITTDNLSKGSKNLKQKSFNITFNYKDFSTAKTFDDTFPERKIITLNYTTHLLIDAHWMINNKKIHAVDFNSDLLTVDIIPGTLPTSTTSLQQDTALSEAITTLSKNKTVFKFVQFSESSKFKEYKIKKNYKSTDLNEAVKMICKNNGLSYSLQKNECLLSENEFASVRQIYWAFINKEKSGRNARFQNGAFISSAYNSKVWLLPSARAYICKNQKDLLNLKAPKAK